MQHTETIAIDQPIEAIWELVGNPSRWNEWMDGLTDVHFEGEPRAGAPIAYRWRGKERKNSIARIVSNQEIAIHGEESSYSYTESIILHGMGKMTSVTISMDFQPKVWWATALTPAFFAIKKLSVGRPMRKSLDGLSREASKSRTAFAA